MGNEALCAIRFDGRTYDGKVLLETEEVIVRVDRRIVIPFRKLSAIDAVGGELRLAWDDHEMSIALGADAAKWAEKIRNPKSRLDKIGVKRGQRVSVIGVDDEALAGELALREVDISTRVRGNSDLVFFGAPARAALAKLTVLRDSLKPDGALWIIRPKGSKEISEGEVMAAGKAAGLVDVKVVKFSETHTAEKFVIPLAKR